MPRPRRLWLLSGDHRSDRHSRAATALRGWTPRIWGARPRDSNGLVLGAETSDIWNGYMDGAIRSGRRAAAEILTNTN